MLTLIPNVISQPISIIGRVNRTFPLFNCSRKKDIKVNAPDAKNIWKPSTILSRPRRPSYTDYRYNISTSLIPYISYASLREIWPDNQLGRCYRRVGWFGMLCDLLRGLEKKKPNSCRSRYNLTSTHVSPILIPVRS